MARNKTRDGSVTDNRGNSQGTRTAQTAFPAPKRPCLSVPAAWSATRHVTPRSITHKQIPASNNRRPKLGTAMDGYGSNLASQYTGPIDPQSPVSIQTKLNRQFGTHRTLTAIEAKRQRMNLLNNLDGMNLRQLAEALGVAKITVHRWLDCGRIRGLVRFPHLQEVGRHMWFFPTPEIRRFILENLECLDLGRVVKHWFVSVVRGSYRRRR